MTLEEKLRGICWPMCVDGDDSLPWVERDNEAAIFENDEEAAHVLAEIIGARVMWAEAERIDGEKVMTPFVMPWSPAMTRTYSGGWQKMCDLCLEAAKKRINTA